MPKDNEIQTNQVDLSHVDENRPNSSIYPNPEQVAASPPVRAWRLARTELFAPPVKTSTGSTATSNSFALIGEGDMEKAFGAFISKHNTDLKRVGFKLACTTDPNPISGQLYLDLCLMELPGIAAGDINPEKQIEMGLHSQSSIEDTVQQLTDELEEYLRGAQSTLALLEEHEKLYAKQTKDILDHEEDNPNTVYQAPYNISSPEDRERTGATLIEANCDITRDIAYEFSTNPAWRHRTITSGSFILSVPGFLPTKPSKLVQLEVGDGEDIIQVKVTCIDTKGKYYRGEILTKDTDFANNLRLDYLEEILDNAIDTDVIQAYKDAVGMILEVKVEPYLKLVSKASQKIGRCTIIEILSVKSLLQGDLSFWDEE